MAKNKQTDDLQQIQDVGAMIAALQARRQELRVELAEQQIAANIEASLNIAEDVAVNIFGFFQDWHQATTDRRDGKKKVQATYAAVMEKSLSKGNPEIVQDIEVMKALGGMKVTDDKSEGNELKIAVRKTMRGGNTLQSMMDSYEAGAAWIDMVDASRDKRTARNVGRNIGAAVLLGGAVTVGTVIGTSWAAVNPVLGVALGAYTGFAITSNWINPAAQLAGELAEGVSGAGYRFGRKVALAGSIIATGIHASVSSTFTGDKSFSSMRKVEIGANDSLSGATALASFAVNVVKDAGKEFMKTTKGLSKELQNKVKKEIKKAVSATKKLAKDALNSVKKVGKNLLEAYGTGNIELAEKAGKMSKDFSDKTKSIWSSVTSGISNAIDSVEQMANFEGKVWIEEYVRKDGVNVDGFWRSMF